MNTNKIIFTLFLLGIFSPLFAAKPGPGFGIRNKSDGDIRVNVVNSNVDNARDKILFFAIEKGSFQGVAIDTNKPTVITIKNMDEQIIYKAMIRPGKTIYLNWDGETLYPQRGPLWGATKKSDEGYDLSNNVSATDIIVPKD